MRRGACELLFGVALAGALAGCTDQRAERDFQLRKTEQERDTLRERLTAEQAKTVALTKQNTDLDQELRLAQAEVGRLNDAVAKLDEFKRLAQEQLAQLKTTELKRPEVPPSPLPAATDAALQALAAKYGDRVWYERGRGAISFANDRLFDPGSDMVRTDALAALQDLAGVLAKPELTEFEIIVVGHTDTNPITKPETQAKHPTNWHLSVHRSIAVKDVLDKAGLPAARLGVMGYADQRPLSDDPARNRRVEVFIVRKGGLQAFQPVRPPAPIPKR